MENNKIGIYINQKREEKALTPDQLADALSIPKGQVLDWESGKSYPDFLLIPALAEVLEISANELLQGEDHAKTLLIPKTDSNSPQGHRAEYLFSRALMRFHNRTVYAIGTAIACLFLSPILYILFQNHLIFSYAFLSIGMVISFASWIIGRNILKSEAESFFHQFPEKKQPLCAFTGNGLITGIWFWLLPLILPAQRLWHMLELAITGVSKYDDMITAGREGIRQLIFATKLLPSFLFYVTLMTALSVLLAVIFKRKCR